MSDVFITNVIVFSMIFVKGLQTLEKWATLLVGIVIYSESVLRKGRKYAGNDRFHYYIDP